MISADEARKITAEALDAKRQKQTIEQARKLKKTFESRMKDADAGVKAAVKRGENEVKFNWSDDEFPPKRAGEPGPEDDVRRQVRARDRGSRLRDRNSPRQRWQRLGDHPELARKVMFACYDEQGRIHYTTGRVALCGCRNLIEAVHHDLDGTELMCKACKKAKKRADRVQAVGEPGSPATDHA